MAIVSEQRDLQVPLPLAPLVCRAAREPHGTRPRFETASAVRARVCVCMCHGECHVRTLAVCFDSFKLAQQLASDTRATSFRPPPRHVARSSRPGLRRRVPLCTCNASFWPSHRLSSPTPSACARDEIWVVLPLTGRAYQSC